MNNFANSIDIHDIQYHMSEGCGAFAYALWIANGRSETAKLAIISDVHGEKWYGDEESDEPTHYFEASHVFYIDEDKTIDVKGIRTTAEMIADFGFHAELKGPWSPDDFKNIWMGECDRFPLYCNEEMIEDAMAIINKHPEFYAISA